MKKVLPRALPSNLIININIINIPILIGYIVSAMYICFVFTGLRNYAPLLGFLGGIIWCIWLYNYHKILQKLSMGKYPISPGAALGYCFIPLYNIYWAFKWPIEVSKYISESSDFSIKIYSGILIGLLYIIALFINRYYGIGLILIFMIGSYLNNKFYELYTWSRPRKA